MNETEQIKALAELDGWTQREHTESSFVHPGKDISVGTRWFKESRIERRPPDYLHSYDAIIPLIQKQPKTTQFTMNFLNSLNTEIKWSPSRDLNMVLMLSATPPQLCEALLRAVGKWKE